MAGQVVETSDRRLKESVEPYEAPLPNVERLEPVTYERSGQPGSSQERELGLIAGEVEEVLPELVVEDENGIKGVRYTRLSVVLLSAFRAQQDQIRALESEVQRLRAAVDREP